MTKINKLVMQGFKSFAKKTEVVFDDNFNCILGPNGSGKSNILDALCFVLGKTSSKSMRAEKSANLIYNGGKTKKSAKHAIVSIYFDNTEGIFPLDNKEIKISRRVKQSGSSDYKINDNKVTRTQIVELLSHARINPDGYNIVLQGDIARIVEMSSNERRKIIEEIAGINIYEEKKQKAINELNKVEEKLKEAGIILAERKTYLRELKKERNQAMKFKELDEKIKRNKATMLHLKMDKKQKKQDSLKKEMDKKKKDIEKNEDEIKKIKKEIEEKKEEIKKINKEIEEKGDKDQIKIQKEIEEIRVSISTNKTRINSIENELSRITDRKKQLQQSLSDIDEKRDRLEKEKKSFKEKIEEKEKKIEGINIKIEAFKSDHNIADSENLEKEIEQIDKDAEEKLEEIQNLRQEQQQLLRDKDRLEYQLQSADEKIHKVLEVQKEHQKDLEKLKEIREKFKKATLELNKLLNEDASITAQLGNARSKLLKIKEELAREKAKQAGLRESSARDIAIRKILEQKNSIKGIHGTVSSLGQVDSDYSVALEVAAGSRVKSIVVDTDETAAKCINYLKKNRLGSATFLPLNKIRAVKPSPEAKVVVNKSGVHGLAIDLIKFNPKFRNVFSYVFGNTLVVDDINTARSVGVGRFRMATLDGDLTEKSGAMRGGYRKKSASGSFQEKEMVSKIKELEKEESDLETVVSNLEKQKKETDERITELRHEKAELEAEIIKIEKSLHLEDSDLDMTKDSKKKLGKELEDVDEKLRDVQGNITKANSELAQVKMKKQKIRDKINALRNPALLAELNTFEQKRTELKEEIIRHKTEVKNIDEQIKNMLTPEQSNTHKILKQHDKELEDFKEEQKELKELIKNEEKILGEKESHQKEFYTKFKGLFKKRDGINDGMSMLENEQFKKDEKRRSKENALNSLSLDNAKVTAELDGLKEEYKEFEGVPIYKSKDQELIKKEIWEFEKMVSDIGAVNMRALEVYDQVEKEYNQVNEKKNTLVTEREDVLMMMNEIETKKKDLFMVTYEGINENFKDKFVSLSTKGEANLQLEDPETVFEGGLNIKVRLTGKKFLDIRSLSGGEKTLTALAFLFAVQDHEPAPFYVLDEVDAALDKRNSEKLADLIRDYVSKAQYIVISHNDGVISEADNLYGISMNEHGISKIVSLKI